MNLLYRITHTITTWVFPVLLVLTSFVVMLPMAGQHKAAIGFGGFYNDLSDTLQSPPSQESYSAESVLLRAVFQDLATPQWLKGVVDTNVDNFVSWISGDNDTWEVFIPTDDIEQNVSKTVDNEVEQILDNSSTTIEPCSSERSQQIRSNGLSFDGDFCLPPSVISGEQTLTEFMGLNDESTSESFLNSFLTQNPFNSSNLNVDELFPESGVVTTLSNVRTGYRWLETNLLLIWAIFAAFVLGHLLIAKASSKTFLMQIQKILFLTGINTIILSIVIIMFVAGSNYVSSGLVSFIFPGLVITQIQNMILLRVVLVMAGLLQIAFIISLIFIGLRILLSVLKNMGIIGSVADKNKRLTSPETNVNKNPTLDGEFRRQLEGQEPKPESVSFAPISTFEPDSTQFASVIDALEEQNTNTDNNPGFVPLEYPYDSNQGFAAPEENITPSFESSDIAASSRQPPVIVPMPKEDPKVINNNTTPNPVLEEIATPQINDTPTDTDRDQPKPPLIDSSSRNKVRGL